MSLDIGKILADWPYNNGQITARRIRGDDGRDKIQLRMDLGILQMDVTGRPDGHRPYGYESLLDFYENELKNYETTNCTDEGFQLDEQACETLRAESTMYYHRYLAAFVLEDFETVERDAMRNLRLFDFCGVYAKDDSDRYFLEQHRPYVLMMAARARALRALGSNRPRAALDAVKKGLDAIKAFYRRYEQDKAAANSSEIAILKALAKEIESRIPIDPVQQVQRQLARAIKDERYEEAAALRDQLNRIVGADHEHSEHTERK